MTQQSKFFSTQYPFTLNGSTSALRSQTLAINAGWVQVLSATYLQTSSPPNNNAPLGTIRDPETGAVVPLRDGAFMNFGARRCERLEIEIPAGSWKCNVDLLAGAGDLGVRQYPVIAYDQRPSFFGSALAAGLTLSPASWTLLFAHEQGALQTVIGAAPANVGVVWITPDNSIPVGRGMRLALNGTITIPGAPAIYANGAVTDTVDIIRFYTAVPHGRMA